MIMTQLFIVPSQCWDLDCQLHISGMLTSDYTGQTCLALTAANKCCSGVGQKL